MCSGLLVSVNCFDKIIFKLSLVVNDDRCLVGKGGAWRAIG